MNDDIKRLTSKIQYFEDMLLRSKNQHEIERIRGKLSKMRIDLQKKQWEHQKRV